MAVFVKWRVITAIVRLLSLSMKSAVANSPSGGRTDAGAARPQ